MILDCSKRQILENVALLHLTEGKQNTSTVVPPKRQEDQGQMCYFCAEYDVLLCVVLCFEIHQREKLLNTDHCVHC